MDRGASSKLDRATVVEPVPVSPLRDGIPSAVPAGAVLTQDDFVSRVEEGGRQRKTTVFYVIRGFWDSTFSPFVEEREYIWPLKILDYDGRPFVADVRGRENSFQDMLPNSYNANFAFFAKADADAYLASAAQAIEARRAETLGSACESAVGIADAPTPSPQGTPNAN